MRPQAHIETETRDTSMETQPEPVASSLVQDLSVFRREPTPQEIADTHAHIARISQSAESLRQQNAELFMQQIALQRQRNALQLQEEDYRREAAYLQGVVTLSRRLPPELFAQIFVHCINGGWSDTPVVVSQVCSQWRTAVRLNPVVWSFISIDVSAPDINRLKHWLRMARSTPLHIVVEEHSEHGHRNELRRKAILHEHATLLLQRASQWSTFLMKSPYVKFFEEVLSQFFEPAVFLLLKTVRLELQDPWRRSPEVGVNLNFLEILNAARAPKLHSMCFSYYSLPQDAVKFPTQLRRLELSSRNEFERDSTASILLSLLPLSHLHHLTLQTSILLYSPSSPTGELHEQTIFTLHSVTCLDLATNYTNFPYLLSSIRVPSLRALRIRTESSNRHNVEFMTALYHFSQRSPHIRSLSLLYNGHCSLPSVELFTSCFSVIQQLEELTVYARYSIRGRDIMEALRNNCPKLTKLALGWGPLDGATLVDLVQSRIDAAQDGRDVQPISEILFNSCELEAENVIALARLTRCRVVVTSTDEYQSQRVMYNVTKLKESIERLLADMSPEERSHLDLII